MYPPFALSPLTSLRTGLSKGERRVFQQPVIGMKSIVSKKGQVTIPKPLRDRMNIRPGDVLDFREEKGRLVVTKAAVKDPVEGVYGILKLGRTTDDLMTSLRGAQ